LNRLPKIFLVAALLLASCANNPDLSEEAAYQKYVAEQTGKVRLSPDSLAQLPALREKAYEESGLPAFITNGEIKNIADMDKFYNDVIIGRYSNHVATDYLKVRFIRYTVTYFDLLHSENPVEIDYLVRQTRELIAAKKMSYMQFTYDCLSACRGRMETEEYNRLVQEAEFDTRWMIEQSRKHVTEMDTTSKAPHNPMVHFIKTLEHTLADVKALRIR
jgi:hypothetical protein